MSIYPHINSQIHLFHRHSVKKSNYKIVASKADRIRQHLGMGFFSHSSLFLGQTCLRNEPFSGNTKTVHLAVSQMDLARTKILPSILFNVLMCWLRAPAWNIFSEHAVCSFCADCLPEKLFWLPLISRVGTIAVHNAALSFYCFHSPTARGLLWPRFPYSQMASLEENTIMQSCCS